MRISSAVLLLPLLLCTLLGIGACNRPGYLAPRAYVVTNARINRDAPKLSSSAVGRKIGMACVSSVFFIASWGDAGIRIAAANGGITEIQAVDFTEDDFFGPLYSRVCTIVHGN